METGRRSFSCQVYLYQASSYRGVSASLGSVCWNGNSVTARSARNRCGEGDENCQCDCHCHCDCRCDCHCMAQRTGRTAHRGTGRTANNSCTETQRRGEEQLHFWGGRDRGPARGTPMVAEPTKKAVAVLSSRCPRRRGSSLSSLSSSCGCGCRSHFSPCLCALSSPVSVPRSCSSQWHWPFAVTLAVAVRSAPRLCATVRGLFAVLPVCPRRSMCHPVPGCYSFANATIASVSSLGCVTGKPCEPPSIRTVRLVGIVAAVSLPLPSNGTI